MSGAVREGEGEEGGEEKGRTEAPEEEVEGKDDEEHNQELEQQEKEAEIREVSRNRKAPKEEEVQTLTKALGDRAIVMSVMRCVEDPKRVAVLEW